MAPPEWRTYDPDPTPDREPAPAQAKQPTQSKPPKRPRQAPTTPSRPGLSRGQRRLRTAIIVGGIVVAVGLPTSIAVVAGNDDVQGAIGIGGRPQTAEGFAELVDDLADEVGSTEVFEAVIYPKYAVVGVPLKKGDEREVNYYWDGGLSESSKGTSDYVPFDLADVDGSALAGLCDQAERLVEDPGDCYVIVRRPRESLNEGWLWAYTSNEFSQGGYINFDLAGNEVSRSTW